MFDKRKLLPNMLLLVGFSAVAAFADSVIPGTLNYLEGSVSLNGQPLTSESIGKAKIGENQALSVARVKPKSY